MNKVILFLIYLFSTTLWSLSGCTNNNMSNVYVTDSNNTSSEIFTIPNTTVSCTVTTHPPIISTTPTVTTITTFNIPNTITSISTISETTITDIIDVLPTTIPDNTLCINNLVIYLTYADATQFNIDNYDVVYSTGYVIDENTEFEHIESAENVYPYTMLFGHDYKSFSILPNLIPGELFNMNVQGSSVTYEIQRSERGYNSDDGTTIYSYSDNIDMLFNDYGYEALILITCYGADRWVIVAKPI